MLGRKKRKLLLLVGVANVLALFLISCKNSSSQTESTWDYHSTPEEAGWSDKKLQEAKEFYDSLGSTAAMVIYDGKVLFEWGDVSRKSNIHSVRKSFLSALYGIHVNVGTIHIEDTLKELEITDRSPLSVFEQEATVEDLLTSRSGIFLRAGEESLFMRWNRPEREAHVPGTYFHYNNWDFNVLGTIFNQQTKSDLFQEFYEKIAIPLGMEDYSPEDSFYKFEEDRSIHPSYLFRMSARDMARFGQLYLQDGQWAGQQLIPKEWVKQSTSVQTPVRTSQVYGYGYMWWVADNGHFEDVGLYSAIGRYGQSIDIIPDKNLVFVHRVDSDRFLNRTLNHVNDRNRLRLLEMILDAKQPNE
ncbi:beta-lactamase family protein [Alkalihalobacillus sp. MEB130]|uniref:serine hydrolase domain-containing protein n=1 Tax=Alkalihalobacillus sp. MEB130 TaxID=2976704 RepID=UPI0028DE6505|nr:serine hydrolase [Alkalihalobacillus sp. MEB130]MDT8859908.1 beta-lactamase family protein [Alkalihalobacillus sp. MEB130]